MCASIAVTQRTDFESKCDRQTPLALDHRTKAALAFMLMLISLRAKTGVALLESVCDASGEANLHD